MAKKFSDLKALDKVAVRLHKVQEVRQGETKTIKEETDIVMTKAGFELIEKTDNGYCPAMNRRVELLGIPKFKEVDSEYGSKVPVLEGFEKLAEEKAAEPAA